MAKIDCMTCDKQFDSMREVNSCLEIPCGLDERREPRKQPDLAAYADWFASVCRDKPSAYLPSLREAFLAGWHAGSDHTFGWTDR